MNDRTDYDAIIALPCVALGASTRAAVTFDPWTGATRVQVRERGRTVSVFNRYANGWEGPRP